MTTNAENVPAARLQLARSVAPPPPRVWSRNLRPSRHGAGLLFLLTDAVAFVIATVAAGSAWPIVVPTLLLLACLNYAVGLYRGRLSLSVLDDLPRILGRVLAAGAAGLIVAAVLAPSQVIEVVHAVVVLLVAVPACRALSYWLARLMRRHGVIGHPALILGAGLVGQGLAEALLAQPETGLRPVGFIDDSPLGGDDLPIPVLGGVNELAGRIVERDVDHVVIAFSHMPESELVDAVRTCDRLMCEISVVPRLFELSARGRDSDEIDGISLTRLRRAPFRSPQWRLKRVMDVATSAIALLLLSPVLLVVALTIRLVDGKGVIFRQDRVGLDGRTFAVLKFRTLAPADEHESETRWNVKGDERISWLGRLLRKSSLDELPQLWNVLRGDMSLVGPRPERPHFVQYFDELFPRYGARLRVPSGVTGWAQIHGLRGDTSIEERARYDNYYVENWSLWLDFKILVRTVGSLMRGSG